MTSALSRGEDDVDREALFCALVLSPLTFPRNRFFRLFSVPWAKRTRFRAGHIRSILRHLAALDAEPTRASVEADDHAGIVLRYEVPRLGLHRTAVLDRLELAVMRFALARAGAGASPTLQATDEDRRLVEEALAKLGRRLELAAPSHLPLPDNGGS